MDFSGFADILNDFNTSDSNNLVDDSHNIAANGNVFAVDIKQLTQDVFNAKDNPSKNKKVIDVKKQNNKVNLHSGHRQRARERFLSNPEGTSDYDLLELLLFLIIPRADTKPIAKCLIDKYKTLRDVFNADICELNNFGIKGEAVKYLSTLIKSTQKRILKQDISASVCLDNSEKLIQYCQVSIGNLQEEQFRIIFFNSKWKVLDDVNFGVEEVSSVSFSYRQILQKTLDLHANSVVLYHNHPNHDVEPSGEDISATTKIVECLKNINVYVLDHIIVSGALWFSFKDNNLL